MSHYAPIPPVAPGVCVALYDGGMNPATLLSARTRGLLAAARPQVLMPHCGPSGFRGSAPDRFVSDARTLLPDARLWFGVGVDGLTNKLHANPSDPVVEQTLVDLARNAKRLGVEAIVWDQESVGEAHPVAGEALARMAIKITRELAPGVLQGFTSYDHPVAVPVNAAGYPAKAGEKVVRHFGGHEALAWRAWLGDGGCDFSAEQTYVADSPSKPASKGALARRQATSAASFAALERKGKARPGLPRAHYNQLWGVPCAQTINAELSSHLWCGWAGPVGSRWDLDGRLAVLGSCELRRRGVRSVDDVKALQRELGVTDDGVVGPVTLGKLGIRREDWA